MNWSKVINTDELKDIAELIKTIEQKSSAEIITVIANRSSTIRHIKFTLFLILSVLILTCFHIFKDFINPEYQSLLLVSLHFISIFVSFLLAKLNVLQRLFIPACDRKFQVETMAEREFYVQRLHMTNEKTGLLIYISILEKQVVVLADKTISDKLPDGSWHEIINHIIQGVHKNNIHKGIIQGINSCAPRLTELFPATKDNSNELPNHVILRRL